MPGSARNSSLVIERIQTARSLERAQIINLCNDVPCSIFPVILRERSDRRISRFFASRRMTVIYDFTEWLQLCNVVEDVEISRHSHV